MFKFISFIEYATKNNLDISSKEKRAESYKIYRREYMNAYNKNRKYSSARFNLTLSKEQYHFFEKKASEHGYKSIGKFIVDSAESYHKQEFLNPNKSELQKLIFQIRSIGNGINTISFHMASKRLSPHRLNVDVIYKKLSSLEDLLVYFIQHPKLKQSEED
jgi:hypothetical protein